MNNLEGMRVFANKEPVWSDGIILLFIYSLFHYLEVQAFVLNFNGRVDKPSVKNFQLVDAKDGKLKMVE